MSAVIQRKKFTKASGNYNKSIAIYERQDNLYNQYLRIFEDFETNFNKHFSQNNLRSLKNTLDYFYKNLKNNELLITDLSKHEENFSKTSKDIFLIQKASKTIELLADYLVSKRTAIMKNRRVIDLLDSSTSESRDVTLMVIKVLKLFAMVNPSFATILSHWSGFTETLLRLVMQDNKLYFKQVLTTLEALIATNASTITPAMHPLVLEIISNMPKKNFARFSRIVALFVLENSEKTDFKELPSEFTENKMLKIHSFLLSVPNLLESYTVILEQLKEIINCLSSTNTENIHKTITHLKESKLIKDSGLNLSFLKPLFDQCQVTENLISEIFNIKFMTKFIVKKSNITEILFIISNLLAGKRKINIQDQLTQINFFQRIIDPLFDILFHPEVLADEDEMSDGGNNPLTTTRIQLLRIIINFCDRDSDNFDNKRVFISDEEYQILQNHIIQKALSASDIRTSSNLMENKKELTAAIDQVSLDCNPDTLFNEKTFTENAFSNVQNKGLLNKLITLLQKYPGNSSFYFWLASCTESFLRGFNYSHQIFVAHSGLLYNLLNQILTSQITKSNNIQISYDLLGEIVKFNKYNMLFLESLCRTFGWNYLLPKLVAKNVVDSNVFLRSMLLSFEKFNVMCEREVEPVIKTKLMDFNTYLTVFDNLNADTPEWFNSLIETVEPSIINQDNICCINTALLMAIFAEQRGDLQRYLNSLVDQSIPRTKTVRVFLDNFNKVLNIWQKYYISKTKDCFSLQYTTSIKFFYFQDIKNKIQAFLEKNLQHLSQ